MELVRINHTNNCTFQFIYLKLISQGHLNIQLSLFISWLKLCRSSTNSSSPPHDSSTLKYFVCLLPSCVHSLVMSYPLFVTCTFLMRLTCCTCLILLVYTVCPILLAGISLLPLRNRVVWSGEVIFGQEVVGGRKVVELDWVELDEGLMAWWRVLQMIDEDRYLL